MGTWKEQDSFLWLIQMFACFFLHLPYISKSFRKLTRWKLKHLLFEYPQREDPISPTPKVSGETCKIQAGGLGPFQGPGAGRRVTGSGLPHPPVPPCLHLTFIYAKGNKQNGGEYIWGCLYKLYIYICTARLLSWVWLLAASPMDFSRPALLSMGFSQGRIQEWVAISSSRGSLQPRDPTRISYVSCIGRWLLYH